jgi:AraC-like DNA-binding protein
MAFATHRSTGVLGAWTAVGWQPAHLRGVVDRLWHFSGRVTHPRERVLPGGHFQLVVHLQGRYAIVDGTAARACAAISVCGLQTRPFVIQAPRDDADVLGIELTPAGARRIFGRPLHEISGADVDLGDLVGPEADALGERCVGPAGAEDRLRAAAAWLEARLAIATPDTAEDSAIAWIAGRIRHRRGDVPIAALRDAAGLSPARLAPRFREQIGLTPKAYARLERFRHAAERLRAGETPVDVAAMTGYCDQPHLTQEFRAFAGVTPAAYAAGLRYDTGVNVPET